MKRTSSLAQKTAKDLYALIAAEQGFHSSEKLPNEVALSAKLSSGTNFANGSVFRDQVSTNLSSSNFSCYLAVHKPKGDTPWACLV